jgi:hypothetical protein
MNEQAMNDSGCWTLLERWDRNLSKVIPDETKAIHRLKRGRFIA